MSISVNSLNRASYANYCRPAQNKQNNFKSSYLNSNTSPQNLGFSGMSPEKLVKGGALVTFFAVAFGAYFTSHMMERKMQNTHFLEIPKEQLLPKGANAYLDKAKADFPKNVVNAINDCTEKGMDTLFHNTEKGLIPTCVENTAKKIR